MTRLSGRLEAAYRRLIRHVARTRWFTWLGIHAFTPLDRWLYPRFHGRLISAGPPVLPLLLLTTRGRRTGQPRATPLLYIEDGDDLVVVGSNWGQAHHPAWSANLLNDPHAMVEIDGVPRCVAARLASPAELRRLWPLLLEHFPPYQAYADRSGRDLRVFLLTVVSASDGAAWVTQAARPLASSCAGTGEQPASLRRPWPSAPS